MALKPKVLTNRRLAFIQRGVGERFNPQSAIEQMQGDPLATIAPENRGRQLLDQPVDYKGWRNPWKITYFPTLLPAVNAPQMACNGNFRRAYLIIQNKGPGNISIGFGQAADVVGGNSIDLVPGQIYEIIGGGSADRDGRPQPSSFVPRDFVSLNTDQVNTLVVVGEGVWVYTP